MRRKNVLYFKGGGGGGGGYSWLRKCRFPRESDERIVDTIKGCKNTVLS